MSCEQLSALLAESSPSELPLEFRKAAAAHLATCRACREMVETVGGIQAAPAPAAPVAPADLTPVRPMPSAGVFVGLAIVIPVFMAGLGTWWCGQNGWAALGGGARVWFALLAAALLGTLAFGLFRQFKPGSRETVDGRIAAVAVLVGFATFALGEYRWHPAPNWDLAEAWGCFRIGSEIAGGAAMGLIGLARSGYAPKPGSAWLWAGALAGVAGMVSLTMLCPNGELSHVILGHLSVVVGMTALVALIGTGLLDRRR